MNKISISNVGEEIHIKYSFDNPSECLRYFLNEASNDVCDYLKKMREEDELEEEENEDESEGVEMVEKMVSSVSTECLHDFMKVIIDELKSRQ